LGAVGTFTLLPVLAARAEARSTWVQARAARLVDTVALYQALGGGSGQ
jgi:outer membrane protein TolC